jgi:hypothetical protein
MEHLIDSKHELLQKCAAAETRSPRSPGIWTAVGRFEKIQAFVEWAKMLATSALPLSDEAISRRSIYEQ